jgi:hypothetical protein
MKILVTGGCSFSQVLDPHYTLEQGGTWPHNLKLLAFNDSIHIATGLEGQGNGLISRKIIKEVSTLLETTDAKEILVGVMWSGPDRYERYVGNDWQILYHSDPEHRFYYTKIHSRIGSLIVTCEHILRLQWFLKLHNINYFMTTYTSEVLPSICQIHQQIKYLYDQIDQSHFLPVIGEYEWCRDYSGITFPVKDDFHPGFRQHRAFTEQIIIPFLKEKNYI